MRWVWWALAVFFKLCGLALFVWVEVFLDFGYRHFWQEAVVYILGFFGAGFLVFVVGQHFEERFDADPDTRSKAQKKLYRNIHSKEHKGDDIDWGQFG
ncbi:hypothetical protein [Yinghuangia soli]|uniref:Uncharacterized protein n=1 Tax=Yinghuangia soli TaxID=2908204 RepID=A0AA41U2I9_9ACTN|nr:hypothetical protein [Yinghuangia soli]MCF2530730.1 hypothetical protein [Yinghuangia soli]